jgi:hypothetical protein
MRAAGKGEPRLVLKHDLGRADDLDALDVPADLVARRVGGRRRALGPNGKHGERQRCGDRDTTLPSVHAASSMPADSRRGP